MILQRLVMSKEVHSLNKYNTQEQHKISLIN